MVISNDKSCLFPLVCRANHACVPNCTYIWDDETGLQVFEPGLCQHFCPGKIFTCWLVTPLRTKVATFSISEGGGGSSLIASKQVNLKNNQLHLNLNRDQDRNGLIFWKGQLYFVTNVLMALQRNCCFAHKKCIGHHSCCRTCMPVTISFLGRS